MRGNDDNTNRCFEEWAREYSAELYRRARLILRDSQDAEDCVQQALLRAFRSGYRDIENPRAWLHRIVANCAYNMIRKRNGEGRAMDRLDPPELITQDEDERLRRMHVAEALGALPDDLRILIVLRYYEGRSDADIGEIVGIPAGTVKSRLHRARQMLASGLTELM